MSWARRVPLAILLAVALIPLTSTVVAEASGRVVRLEVQVGQSVAGGELLMELE